MTEDDILPWPVEAARAPGKGASSFSHAGSNICLDFHGDPAQARLVVFSDGNHHMALEQCAQAFLKANPDVADVFYATTPPGPLIAALETGALHIGNLALSAVPDVFIGPGEILDKLSAAGRLESHQPFAESRGNAFLVCKDNPKGIQTIAELMRDDVTIAISNPDTEKASFNVYADTLEALASEAGLDGQALKTLLSAKGGRVVFSTAIHHREVPQMLADGAADVAMVYYHLALRYVRIFPDVFDMVALGGSKDDPDPGPAHQITRYHLGLIGDGGDWGQAFADFMVSDESQAIYRDHGLKPLTN